LPGLHAISNVHQNSRNFTGLMGDYRRLHFHGLNDENAVTLTDLLANCHEKGFDHPSQGAYDIASLCWAADGRL